MKWYDSRRYWSEHLIGIALFAALLAGLAGCGQTSSPGAPISADTLVIRVVQHTITPHTPQPATDKESEVFSRIIDDSSAIAQVQSLITSMTVVSPTAVFNCPNSSLQYYSYDLRFFRASRLVEEAAVDVTECQFLKVNQNSIRCCPTSDFWARLHQATGAPVPSSR
jgi:hypothetical protein